MPTRKPRRRQGPVAEHVLETPDATLLDLLDRLLDTGVMLSGDVVFGVAGVDLIYLRLSALACAADRILPPGPPGTGARRRHARRRGRA